MGRKLRVPKIRSDKLTEEQEDDLIGFREWPRAFRSPLERRAMWVEPGDELMDEAQTDRPQAWRDYDSPRDPRRIVARRGDPPL